MISIITPTIRPKGLEIVAKSLSWQTLTDYEWLVGSSFKPEHDCVWVKDDFKGGFWTLNRIYNKLISKAKGNLLVSWQDFTYADPEALSKFLFYYRKDRRTIATGVGGKYEDDSWTNRVWQDPRERDDLGSMYETDFANIEGNFCGVPKRAMYDIGGFDEELDQLGFGMDWYGVLERLYDFGGYRFMIDQTNKSYSLEHGRVGGKKWDKHNLLDGGYQRRRTELIKADVYPVLGYLQENGKIKKRLKP